MSHHIERINAWTCYNAYAWVPFFTHMAHAFRVIFLENWALQPRFSNLRVKLAKHEVMVSIIFIMSPITGSTSHPIDCLGLKLVVIWPSMSSDFTIMAKVLCLRTSLCLRKRLSFCLGLSHNWIWRLCQNLLNHNIWFLFNLHILNKRSWYQWFLGFNKLHLLKHISA